MLEPPVSWLRDATSLSRRIAALVAGSVSFVLGILAALSFNVLSDIHPLGSLAIFEDKTFFDLFDYLVTNIMMPAGGIMIAIFAGWMVKREFSCDELFDGKDGIAYRGWLFLTRYVAPAILAFVLVDMATG